MNYLRKTEMPTCDCGNEAEWAPQLGLASCDTCGGLSCNDCRHQCEWCSHEGCEACMTDGVDGWTCGVECEQALAKHAQEQDLLADEHVLEIVVGKMIDCVISHDEERRGAA